MTWIIAVTLIAAAFIVVGLSSQPINDFNDLVDPTLVWLREYWWVIAGIWLGYIIIGIFNTELRR